MLKFKYRETDGEVWRWRLYDGDNIIAVSTDHYSKLECLRSIRQIKKNAPDAPVSEEEDD